MNEHQKKIQSEQNVVRFCAIAGEMAELYEKKNADYGNSFSDTYQRLGMISAVTRIQDKCNRLCNLAVHQGQQQVKDESIRDTLVDLANYAIMTLIEMEREAEANT